MQNTGQNTGGTKTVSTYTLDILDQARREAAEDLNHHTCLSYTMSCIYYDLACSSTMTLTETTLQRPTGDKATLKPGKRQRPS